MCVVSRKDCRRPGRRFLVRGLNEEGECANFVETEQVFWEEKDGIMKVSSYV